MDGIGSDRCSECRGSGKCEECHGTGVNLHLNVAERRCRACNGSCLCASCTGSGERPFELFDAPISLRLLLSAIPVFLLYEILVAQEPVHWGEGGPIVPSAVAWLIVIGICVPTLRWIWKGIRLDDFKLHKNRGRTSLSESPTALSTGKRRSGIEEGPP